MSLGLKVRFLTATIFPIVTHECNVKRRDDDYAARKVLEMQLPGKRKSGGSKYLDVVK